MLRLTLAVAAGFVTLSALSMATRIAILKFFFHDISAMDADLPAVYLLANGVIGLFYAIVAGCVAAAIGKRYEAPTILGALLLGIAIGGLAMNRGAQPLWYLATAPFVAAVAATIAGYRWLGRDGLPRR